MTSSAPSADALFAAAASLPAAERSGYLKRACGGDEALYAKVHSLLESLNEAAQFVKEPSAFSAESMGDRIGDYRLIEEIGEGGGGTVYLAEQLQPIRREVALKIIKLGMDTKAVINRFEAERQALALMDHQHIAKVFDAGATPTGRPYFVMELVRGIKITEYCDQCRLTVPERLELFIQVCQAIQHAHLKGVIHRDIKPSNVLVTLSDGQPLVKVIDFGIAKAMQGRLTEHTVHTVMEQFIGTPAYVSPEQTEAGAPRVDTRSDVYSLGVVLYELLTGFTPFNSDELLQLGIDRMRKRIREDEPMTPSRRLDTLSHARATRIAARQQAEAGQLTRQGFGDLDWIVMRCLEKDADRRYQSAGDLALDLHRYLRHEPVSARRPSLFYTVSKLAQRHRTVFITGLAIIIVLLAATAVSTWQAIRATQAERLAQKTIDSLVNVFSAADPFSNQGAGFSAHELLERAGAAAQSLTRYPDVQLRLLESVGRIHRRRGDLQESKKYLDQALAVRAALSGPASGATLNTYFEAAMTYMQLGELQRARELLVEATRRSEQIGDTSSTLYARLVSLHGKVELSLGNPVQAKELLDRALDVTQRTVGTGAVEAAVILMYMSEVYGWMDDLQAAEDAAREALRNIEAHRPAHHPDRIIGEIRLAEVLHLRGAYEDAARLFETALQEQATVFGRNSTQVADILHALSRVRRSQGLLAQSEEYARESLRINEQIKGEDHYATALARGWLGIVLSEEQKYAAAEAELRRTLLTFREKLPWNHPFTASAEYSLAEVLIATDRLREAEEMLRSAIDHGKSADAPAWRSARAAGALGEVLYRQGRVKDAEPLLIESYRTLTTAQGVDREVRIRARERLAHFYRETGRAAEAKELAAANVVHP